MLTPRGWWLLVLVLAVTGIGGALALRGAPSLLLVCLTLITWLGFEGVLFSYRARIVARRLTVSRELRDNRGPVASLWDKRSYQVRVSVTLERGRLPFAILIDRPPAGAELVGPISVQQGAVAGQTTWDYVIQPAGIGVVRFEGVRLRLADLQGFYYLETFLRAPVELPVLPAPEAEDEPKRANKRFNMLPPPGVHRHRRPGTGSELLELREYRPGDPPRRIAWKVSARRDQLITREYENEVPLRCTLIIDASDATRLGPLARFAGVAAAVARSGIANRDLIGLTISTGTGTAILPPARSSRHLIAILEAVARVAPLMPIVDTDRVIPLLQRALPLANELFPELMHPGLNRFPFWLPWLSPPPAVIRRHGRLSRLSRIEGWTKMLATKERRRYADRKRMAALLAAVYTLPVGATAMLTENDRTMASWLAYFLAEHRVPYAVPMRDELGRDSLARPEPLIEQAAALTRAVSRGRDNELFVLMGEYAARSKWLEPLLKAIRVARGRHHRVLIVQAGDSPGEPGPPPLDADVTALAEYADRARRARGWHAARRAFAKIGVPMIPSAAGESARLILARLEQLRTAQGVGAR